MRRSLSRTALLLACSGACGGCKRTSESPPSPVVELAAGGSTTCARLADGSTWCWGESPAALITAKEKASERTYTPLGPEHAYHDRPVRLVSALPRIEQLVLGADHACARASDGAVHCWGGNDACQLGLGAVDSAPHPTASPVPGVSALALAAGGDFTCAVAKDGRARCWGTLERATRPSCATTDVPGLPAVTQIAIGAAHACALATDGTVWCWGSNDASQLGRGAPVTGDHAPAALVPGLDRVRELAAARSSTCALRADATVWCWGNNGSRLLGSGDPDERPSPTAVPGLRDVARIALGSHNACALLADATLRCWGTANHVGDGSEESRLSPVQPKGLPPTAQLAVGGGVTMGHTCVLARDGAVRCWGSSKFGQLGNGSTLWSASPVVVEWPR